MISLLLLDLISVGLLCALLLFMPFQSQQLLIVLDYLSNRLLLLLILLLTVIATFHTFTVVWLILHLTMLILTLKDLFHICHLLDFTVHVIKAIVMQVQLLWHLDVVDSRCGITICSTASTLEKETGSSYLVFWEANARQIASLLECCPADRACLAEIHTTQILVNLLPLIADFTLDVLLLSLILVAFIHSSCLI